MVPPPVLVLLDGLGLGEGIFFVKGLSENHSSYNKARQYCDSVGKPLLRIGLHRAPWEPPNGDYTLDIDPIVQQVPGGVWGDERQMPFTDKQFGCCFNENTLEHLHTANDVQLAVNECVRVADFTILIFPDPRRIHSTFMCPDHNLLLRYDKSSNIIDVKQNNLKTGLGWDQGANENSSPLITVPQARGPIGGAPRVISLDESVYMGPRLSDLLPALPLDGPPLPRIFGIGWP